MLVKKLTIKNKNATISANTKTYQVYKGFSSSQIKTNFKLYDTDVIRQDLINQFNTRKGERVMLPDYGSIIWDALFEPLTDNVRSEIGQDINRILTNDPRIIVKGVRVDEQQTGILVEITVTYKLNDQTQTLALNFNKELGLVVQ